MKLLGKILGLIALNSQVLVNAAFRLENIKFKGRGLTHVHLQSAALYGNSTDLQYYYITAAFGSQKQTQTLILDTGSSVAAVPCEDFCDSNSCGKHLNKMYVLSDSETGKALNCKSSEYSCTCTDFDRCVFYQGYQEGSSYDGYIVSDMIYLGENYDEFDGFTYKFGCAKRETNLFYTQAADGILGMARGGGSSNLFTPIYDVLYYAGLIEKRVFSLCMGKNGGYFQLGGSTGQGNLEQDISWSQFQQTDKFKVKLYGFQMNSHFMKGSDTYSVGLVDSGTTFTYFPMPLLKIIKNHFYWFCDADKNQNCLGGLLQNQKDDEICFQYDQSKFPNGPLSYFASYPILKLKLMSADSNPFELKWYPSEYLYRRSVTEYCLAAIQTGSSELILGGTMLRQHNLIFDIANNKIGVVSATCNEDVNQIKSEQMLIDMGQKTWIAGQDSSVATLNCNNHGSIPTNEAESLISNPAFGNIISFVLSIVMLCCCCCCCKCIKMKVQDYRQKKLEKAQKQLERDIQIPQTTGGVQLSSIEATVAQAEQEFRHMGKKQSIADEQTLSSNQSRHIQLKLADEPLGWGGYINSQEDRI